MLQNYRPVSNRSFISKLIEKALANQLYSYINKEGCTLQSQPISLQEIAFYRDSTQMPSHSLMGSLKVLSWIRCFSLFTLPPPPPPPPSVIQFPISMLPIIHTHNTQIYLGHVRKFLSVDTAALLANSMISSRIDYCNSLLYGLNKYNVAKLQKIQNALCRIVFRLDQTSHITSYLQKLHWLPILYRILFKYNLITFKTINFSQPTYLSSLSKTSSLTRGNRLSLSSVRPKKAIGRRGFAMASPTEWTRLPQLVRSQNTIIR